MKDRYLVVLLQDDSVCWRMHWQGVDLEGDDVWRREEHHPVRLRSDAYDVLDWPFGGDVEPGGYRCKMQYLSFEDLEMLLLTHGA